MNEKIERMRARERVSELVLGVVAFAPGAVVALGFAIGFAKWLLEVVR